MAMSEGDKALVREIAFEAAGVLKDEVRDEIKTVVRLHAAECTTKAKVDAMSNQRKGARVMFATIVTVLSVLSALLAVWLKAHFTGTS